MILQVSRLFSPVSALGPGRRVGLWVQGCNLACPGCASVDTWDMQGGSSADAGELADRILKLLSDDRELTGISLTGGEPVLQGSAAAHLVGLIKAARRDVDVLLFTGFTLPAARRRAPELLNVVDAAVAGPYRAGAGFGGPMIGSANQELTTLTALGRERLTSVDADRPTMQLAVSDGQLTLIGIPRPGDLERLEERLGARGIDFGAVTWRS